jgi:hypothetical protein
MSRVGQPFNVFAGYIDEAPHYQLYSGPVTIKASCVLKVLQNTYFDPGIPAVAGIFHKYGWFSDLSGSGAIINSQQFDAMDSTGNVRDLLIGVLNEIGGWDKSNIKIEKLPPKLLTELGMLLKAENQTIEDDYDRIIKKLAQFFAVDGLSADVGGNGPGGAASPRSGNIHPTEIATMLLDNGASMDLATKLLAISRRESGFISDNINYNGGGDGSSGDGSYDFGLFQFNTVHANGATNGGKGLLGPGSGASLAELKEAVKGQPEWVQAFYREMSDPQLATAKAVRFGLNDPSLPAWNGTSGISAAELEEARNWVVEAHNKRSNADVPTSPPPGPDEGTTARATKADTIADRILKIAAKEVGNKEAGDSNAGPQVAKYFNETGYPLGNPWCGAFVQWVFLKAGINLAPTRVVSVESFYNYARDHGWLVSIPKPGDLATYRSGDGIYDNGHIGIVVGVANGQYQQIDGNSSGGAVTFDGFQPFSAATHFIRVPGVGNASDDLDINGELTGGVPGVSGVGGNTRVTPGAVSDIARQTAFFQLQTGAFDQFASTMLTGQRALANDISLMTWISGIITGTGRVFMSTPEGEFKAFFPDYFGYYGRSGGGQSPNWFVSEIEILDLTINESDTDLTTHVFATGPVMGWPDISQLDMLGSTVASVEKPAFEWFLTMNEKTWDSSKFLQTYGARPFSFDIPLINKPELIWMGAWMKFLELWSKRFNAQASFTYMPEIQPGWLVNIGNRVQMYVESVTHNFDFSSGFTTSAQLTSAASLTDDIDWLPRAGLESVRDEAATALQDIGVDNETAQIEVGT